MQESQDRPNARGLKRCQEQEQMHTYEDHEEDAFLELV